MPIDTNQAIELGELRRIIFADSKGPVVCQHCKSYRTTNDNLSPTLSPVSSSSESYFSTHEEESTSVDDRPYNPREDNGNNVRENYTPNEDEIRNDSTNPSISLQSNVSPVIQPEGPDPTWNVEFNSDTKVALEMNLVHTLFLNTVETYAAFSIDGKYLATVSATGAVHIFDVKTGKRIR